MLCFFVFCFFFVFCYRKVPFATPPIAANNLRWKKPIPPGTWGPEPLDCKNFTIGCAQVRVLRLVRTVALSNFQRRPTASMCPPIPVKTACIWSCTSLLRESLLKRPLCWCGFTEETGISKLAWFFIFCLLNLLC
jgi:hypothetical protein